MKIYRGFTVCLHCLDYYNNISINKQNKYDTEDKDMRQVMS